ncbi:molybdenum ABC transporter ATP-binding protein [Terasakiella sp. A23]|uniref:molybdenum ABC transporter ATP-binding protein n=1 Tax=Terasakiella sp. FCG-A23 TaxID=3080561 RepID=UPI0029544192|nr:molybdenum ABC transporter ATP-binding protein [Terasakiella sp. A23]MDV7339153.1 molybdenum ABC transporter ATP-binding protein [Terasakiella sp. A23]
MTDIIARLKGSFDRFDLDADFTIPAEGVTALFGQSGCGKTTVLRCLAGLEQVADGYLSVAGEVWQDETTFLPAHKRPIGYVFQDANLFDHLNVRDNLLFGQKRSKAKEGPDFNEVIKLMGLENLLERAVGDLSGGEKQRVAIGRALLSNPRLLLMDEPLSALDRFSKNEIIPYLERLHESLSIPVVYISHDSEEVERLADHLILMEKGRITASGALLDMLADPKLFIAKSSKTASVLEAAIAKFDERDHLTTLKIADKELFVPGYVGQVGETRRVRILATDVSLALEKPSKTTILNVFESRIAEIAAIDDARINVVLEMGAAKLIARITTRSLNSFDFEVGQNLYAQVKGVSMVERRKKA